MGYISKTLQGRLHCPEAANQNKTDSMFFGVHFSLFGYVRFVICLLALDNFFFLVFMLLVCFLWFWER